MHNPFHFLMSDRQGKVNASGQCRSSRFRFRPAFEHLENREVPAIIGGEMQVLGGGGAGAGGGAVAGANAAASVRPFPALSISKSLISVTNTPVVAAAETVADDCIALFRKLGPDVTSGAAREHGNGQLKYWVCHHTGSARNPFVLINVAAPAAFGAHLRHGDIVFIRRTLGGPLTTVELNSQNQLIVTGPDQGPFPVRGNFQVVRRPASALAAAAPATLSLQAGSVLRYAILVANTGNAPLTGLTVTDQVEASAGRAATLVSGDVNGNGILDVREIWAFAASYTLTQADVDSRGGGDGLLMNTATAASNQTASKSAVASVPLVARLAISKTIAGVGPREVEASCVELFQELGAQATSGAAREHGNGQEKYWVCHHTGSARNPFVLINVAAPAAFGAHLRHGDIVFIRRTPGGPLTTVELSADGQLIVSGPDRGPFPVRGNPRLIRQPSLTAPTVASVGALQAGARVNYAIAVANTGTIALTGVSVTDQVESQAATPVSFAGGDLDGDGILDPGEIWSFTLGYTLTQQDLDNRGGGDDVLNNIATVTTNQTAPASATAALALPVQAGAGNPGGPGNPANPPQPAQDDCLPLFLALGVNTTSGAPRAHGNGQVKYWVCHHTGSAQNPFVLINVAAPAAFGAHLRHGDVVFIRRTPGGPVTTVELNANGQLLVHGPDPGPFPVRGTTTVRSRAAHAD